VGLRHIGPEMQTHRPISPEIDVVFRTSISNVERKALLKIASGLLYTPDMEHFGIVPLEAMREGTPVIAVNSGGPLETVLHGRTGYLCPQTPQAFATAMQNLLTPVVVQVLQPETFDTMKKAQSTLFAKQASLHPEDRGSLRKRTASSSANEATEASIVSPNVYADIRSPQEDQARMSAEGDSSPTGERLSEGRLHEAAGRRPPMFSPTLLADLQEKEKEPEPQYEQQPESESRRRATSSVGSESELRKYVKRGGVDVTAVMTMGRRFAFHCRKHVLVSCFNSIRFCFTVICASLDRNTSRWTACEKTCALRCLFA
jgi:hypothetical protein